MLSRFAIRATSAVARRGFHTSPIRSASPYHYPEGPLSNIPFDPRKRFFPIKYWGTTGFFFFLPFGVAYWQLHKNQG